MLQFIYSWWLLRSICTSQYLKNKMKVWHTIRLTTGACAQNRPFPAKAQFEVRSIWQRVKMFPCIFHPKQPLPESSASRIFSSLYSAYFPSFHRCPLLHNWDKEYFFTRGNEKATVWSAHDLSTQCCCLYCFSPSCGREVQHQWRTNRSANLWFLNLSKEGVRSYKVWHRLRHGLWSSSRD